MNKKLYDACKSTKHLAVMKGDGNGLAYLLDNAKYFREVCAFFTKNGVPTTLITNPTEQNN